MPAVGGVSQAQWCTEHVTPGEAFSSQEVTQPSHQSSAITNGTSVFKCEFFCGPQANCWPQSRWVQGRSTLSQTTELKQENHVGIVLSIVTTNELKASHAVRWMSTLLVNVITKTWLSVEFQNTQNFRNSICVRPAQPQICFLVICAGYRCNRTRQRPH